MLSGPGEIANIDVARIKDNSISMINYFNYKPKIVKKKL